MLRPRPHAPRCMPRARTVHMCPHEYAYETTSARVQYECRYTSHRATQLALLTRHLHAREYSWRENNKHENRMRGRSIAPRVTLRALSSRSMRAPSAPCPALWPELHARTRARTHLRSHSHAHSLGRQLHLQLDAPVSSRTAARTLARHRQCHAIACRSAAPFTSARCARAARER